MTCSIRSGLLVWWRSSAFVRRCSVSSVLQRCRFNTIGINCDFDTTGSPFSAIALAVFTLGSPLVTALLFPSLSLAVNYSYALNLNHLRGWHTYRLCNIPNNPTIFMFWERTFCKRGICCDNLIIYAMVDGKQTEIIVVFVTFLLELLVFSSQNFSSLQKFLGPLYNCWTSELCPSE